jgi:phage-related minor tail protein
MPEISKLIVEIDSKGVTKVNGELVKFSENTRKSEKGADNLANKFGAFQLIANKLPGPLKSIASGLMGMVNPATAVTSAIIETAEAAVKFVNESIAAYREAETETIKLGQVLKATGAEAWTSGEALSGYAGTLERSTGRSKTEIQQMQSVLLGFTSITGDNFDRLTKNMIDMSTVMGGSLVGSANAFGKALDMPAEGLAALTRYGFKFTESQKEMINELERTGKHSEAQVQILEAMERAFGGAAEATHNAIGYMADYENAWKKYKATWAETSGIAEIWKKIIPWITNDLRNQTEALKENII